MDEKLELIKWQYGLIEGNKKQVSFPIVQSKNWTLVEEWKWVHFETLLGSFLVNIPKKNFILTQIEV